MSKNVKLFNAQAVKLLDKLYENFPFPLSIGADGLITRPAAPNVPEMFGWFVREKYFRSANDLSTDERSQACEKFKEIISDGHSVQSMLDWKEKIEQLTVDREAFDRDRELLVYTICFLNSEGHVRILKDKKSFNSVDFDDRLIFESLECLKLTLTSKGFAQLSKTVANGKIANSQSETIAEMISEAAKEASGKAASSLSEEAYGWAKLAFGAFLSAGSL
ncbi:hypothetical protein [Metapseudomonas boanensis]|uniref:Uncharacterized protein n=1 Tax=Metapseudomonas boanensis TaxID=2822138 RepID=A0ABS5XF51_9GAMM|nr:hypothetical protein [Pseudomonas boanensis]MBT8766304.1 hypothetical protein [Pseudomonas boanensis]